MAAGDQKCWWGTVIDRGSGLWGLGSPPHKKKWNLIDLISCILVHFGNGHYLFTYYSFRFIAYILTCRAWTSLHCIISTDLLHGHSTSHCYLTHCCYSDIETNHDHCPIAFIFCESQCLLQMQLEIWDSCFILFICYRPKD